MDSGYDISVADDDDPLENISPDLIVLIEALLLPQAEFDRLKSKGKLPKHDKHSPRGARILLSLVKSRIAQYPTNLDMEFQEPLPRETRKRMAKQVRMGEKMILKETEKILQSIVEELGEPRETRAKRNETSPGNGTSKRRKIA